jgi:hypothetical protein
MARDKRLSTPMLSPSVALHAALRPWHTGSRNSMDVQIVEFPETKVAAIEHFGSPALEHDTVRKLVAWKIENRLLDPNQQALHHGKT